MRDSVKFLRGTYRGVRVRSGGTSPIGGIPTTSNAVTLNDTKGHSVSILLSVGTGKQYAYLTNVTARPNCAADLALGRVVLSSVQYTK